MTKTSVHSRSRRARMANRPRTVAFTSPEDVVARIFDLPTSDERRREAVAGYVAGILDVRDAHIAALEADLRAAQAQVAAAERALGELIVAGDDIWAGTDGVSGDVPTYNQMRRISTAMDAIMALGLDPDELRATRSATETGGA